MATGDVALITYADDYVGPGAVDTLLEDGFTVLAHSLRFGDATERDMFAAAHPLCHIASSTNAVDCVAEAKQRFGRVDAALSNDIPFALVDDVVQKVDRSDFDAMVEALLLRPQRFVAAVLETMLAQKSGRLALVTSGAADKFPHRSSDGNTGYLAARAGANALARTLAVKHAADNIQINVIAPFYLYSDRVFPAPGGQNDPAHKDRLARDVPSNRFGEDSEVGALVSFLLSGRSAFTTGQVIAFSGAGA